ncbi:MAG: hypothetical protein AAF721_06105 [Myxococcota bacterium]
MRRGVGVIVVCAAVGCASENPFYLGAASATSGGAPGTSSAMSGGTTRAPQGSTAIDSTMGGSDDEDGGGDSIKIDAVPDESCPAVDRRPCDALAQDCGRDEKCIPTQPFQQPHCVPVASDPVGAGESCERRCDDEIDNCDEESLCAETASGDSQCVQICQGDGDSCSQGRVCAVFDLLLGEAFGVCLPGCNPGDPQPCGQRELGGKCIAAENRFVCVASEENEIPASEPCVFLGDCADGVTCVSNDWLQDCRSAFCCTAICSLGDGFACDRQIGSACVSLGGDGYGICSN